MGLRIGEIRASSDVSGRLRVTGVTASASEVVAAPRLRLVGVVAAGSSVAILPKLRTTGLTVSGPLPAGSPRFRLLGLVASGSATAVVNTLTPVSAGYNDDVTATATLSLGTATGWAWRQVSGPSVVLTASGAQASFKAPAVPPPGGTVVLGVKAFTGGAESEERTLTVTVAPQQRWRRTPGGSWRPGWWLTPAPDIVSPITPQVAGAAPIGTLSRSIPSSNVLYVAPGGSNGNAGTVGSPKATVAGAVSAASAGWTIVVRGGTYTGAVGTINKAVTVMNYPGETVWFDGQNTVQAAMYITAAAQFYGLGWRRYNVTNDAIFDRGIVAPSTADNFRMEDCHFEDFGANVTVAAYNGCGVLNTFNTSGVVIRRCTFKRSGVYHIYTNRTDGMVIENSHFDGSNQLGHNPQPLASAIKHCRSINAVIRHNYIANNPNGQGFWTDVSCYRTSVYGNYIEGGYEAILIELSGTAWVVNNYIVSGRTYGIRSLCSSQITIGWNSVTGGPNNPHVLLGVLQDERNQTRDPAEPYLAQGVTWLSRDNLVIGNLLSGQFAYGQVGVYDYAAANRGGPKEVGQDMVDKVAGNQFTPRADGRNESFQWSHTAGALFSGRSLTQLIAAYPSIVQRDNVPMDEYTAGLLGAVPGQLYAGPLLPAPVLVS